MSNRYRGTGCNEAVWSKAKPVKGKDPNKYRQDPCGNLLYHGSSGKDTPMGWSIDHIKPQSHGGSHGLRNLQAMQSSANKSYQDSTDKPNRHTQH